MKHLHGYGWVVVQNTVAIIVVELCMFVFGPFGECVFPLPTPDGSIEWAEFLPCYVSCSGSHRSDSFCNRIFPVSRDNPAYVLVFHFSFQVNPPGDLLFLSAVSQL